MDPNPAGETPNSIVPFPNRYPGHEHRPSTTDNRTQPKMSGGIRAAKSVAKDEGVSEVTIYRRVKAGLLVKVNINGRAYITLESLSEFYRRALAGDFAREHHGVAKKKVA